MNKFIVLLMLLTSNAYAGCDVQCPVNNENIVAYHDGDHFSWKNYDDDVHLLVGYSGSFLVGQSLVRFAKMPAWEAALIGTLALGLFGTTKEVMFDTYTSRTDIKTYWAGALAGGVTVFVLNF